MCLICDVWTTRPRDRRVWCRHVASNLAIITPLIKHVRWSLIRGPRSRDRRARSCAPPNPTLRTRPRHLKGKYNMWISPTR